MATYYIDYNAELLKNAESKDISEDKVVIDYEWVRLCNLKRLQYQTAPEVYDTCFISEKTHRLVTTWLFEDVFQNNEYFIINIVKYLHSIGVKVLKIIVQHQKSYVNYPKPCEEHTVDSYDDTFRLMITYGFIDETRKSFNPTLKSEKNGIFNRRFNNVLLIFHNLLDKQKGSLKIQCQFDIVYCGDSFEFGVITSPKSLIDYENLIKTCINRYNCRINQYNRMLTHQFNLKRTCLFRIREIGYHRAHRALMRTSLFAIRTLPHRALMLRTLFLIRERHAQRNEAAEIPRRRPELNRAMILDLRYVIRVSRLFDRC
jgi:hypothetical protein